MTYTTHPPSVTRINSRDTSNIILIQHERSQATGQLATVFYSTPFDTDRQLLLSSCVRRCQVAFPHCRGPPSLKSKAYPISEEQEVYLMRWAYIRKSRLCNSEQHSRAKQICAKQINSSSVLWQNAEFLVLEKNLFLIGKGFSYLTVILPDMDNRTGGECV